MVGQVDLRLNFQPGDGGHRRVTDITAILARRETFIRLGDDETLDVA